ncbi:MAG: sensor histidine kinase [Ferruginibacter sp.]
MTNFAIEKFYLFFQGVLVFQAFFLGILFVITRRKDILYYSLFLMLSAVYFFLNAPNTYFGLNDDSVFNSALYLQGNIPLIIITNLFYILFLKVFFSEIYSNKTLDKIFRFIFLLMPVLLVAFFTCRYLKIETQPIFYIVNLLAVAVSIFIIISVFRYRLLNTGWVAWGMVFNIVGTALTIIMIVLERYGIHNLLTVGYPLIFMRVGILADMFFYQVALLKKWHYQEKLLAVEKLQSQLEVEKLRNKISGELHDDIGSTLSGIAMYSHMTHGLLQSGNYEKAGDSVQVIQRSANEIVHKLSDLVWAINPVKESFISMLERIEGYAIQMCVAKNMQFKYNSNITGLLREPGMDLRQQLYLILKEAVNNAVKYSNAREINLDVNIQDGLLNISVADNGNGFDITTVSKGNGLDNMQRRAEAIGATCLIETKPATGTVVLIALPLPE